MTDEKWDELWHKWQAKVKKAEIPPDYNLMPFAVSEYTGYCNAWLSRKHIEKMEEICRKPEFQNSIKLAKEMLQP